MREKHTTTQTSSTHTEQMNRRGFMKVAACLSALPLGGVLHAHNHATHHSASGASSKKGSLRNFQARIFFQNQHEFDVIEAAAERIFPEDELGAGAKKLGVGYFIDRELAGNYGSNANDYRAAPFLPGVAEQGYQYALSRAEMFKLGAVALDAESTTRYKKGFLAISPKQQDEILRAFETNTSKFIFQGISAKDFFTELRYITLAGVFADPIYGGNADMAAWNMKQYPGAQMSYYGQVINNDKREIIPPISLADM